MNSCYLLKWPAFILSPWTRGLIASACYSCQTFWLGCRFLLSIYHDKHNYLDISFYGFYKSPSTQSVPSVHQLQPQSAGSLSVWLLSLPFKRKTVFNGTGSKSQKMFDYFKLKLRRVMIVEIHEPYDMTSLRPYWTQPPHATQRHGRRTLKMSFFLI